MTSSQDLTIFRPADEGEVAAFAKIASQSFGHEFKDVRDWINREGLENYRLIRRGDQLAGGLVVWPLGQWFGGRCVPMTGVRVVATAPEHRGRGVAGHLMRETVKEIHRAGVPLSVLYPATQPVYRRAGYELAGAQPTYRLAIAGLNVRDRTLEVRPIEEVDRETAHELYRRRARRTAGNLERSERIWRRVFEPRGEKSHGYLVQRDQTPEGYVVFWQKATGAVVGYDLEVTDLVALTPDAGRRILTFFAEHRSMAQHVCWVGSPTDPVNLLPPEQQLQTVRRIDWMLRIIDVRGALEARGYAPNVRGEIHFEIHDDLLPDNDGRFVLEVADGAGRVRAGGKGTIDVSIRGLAPLYSGYLSPLELQTAGYLEGPENELIAAGALFAGPTPWMPDMF